MIEKHVWLIIRIFMVTSSCSVEIDEQLFANINADAFLLGSELEGNHFSRTIGFLNKYLDNLDPDLIPKTVRKLQAACNKLVEYQSGIDNLLENPSKEKLSELATRIYLDIESFKNDDFLLLPGGWSTPTGGHAMIYQFSSDTKGNLFFIINNSGSGLKFHPKRSSIKKELYNPSLTYKIPKKNIR